jgi:outer membrane protein assembly factor BamB
VFIGGLDTGALVALDAESGTERWRVKLGDGILCSPAVVGETVFTTGARVIDEDSGTEYLIAVDASNGTERWRVALDAVTRGSPAVVDGTVYIGDLSGIVYAVDTETVSVAAMVRSTRWATQSVRLRRILRTRVAVKTSY